MRLKIRRLDPTVPLPSYGTDLAAASDMDVTPAGRSAQRTVLTSTGFVGSQATRPALVRTGLIIEVPTGHFLGIFARSSTPLKRGLLVANGVGVVDPDYSGPNDEIMIQVLNFTAAAVHIARGDRLAQGVVLPAPRVTWREVDEMRSAGRGGFGATGR